MLIFSKWITEYWSLFLRIQLMLRRLMLLLILTLTACNAQPPATDTVFFTVTPNPIFEPPPQNQSLAGTAVPAEFSGGNPQILSNQNQFEFSVSGDVIAQSNRGTIAYNFVPSIGNFAAHDQLFIASSDASSSQQITFQFGTGIIVGQYALTAPQNFVSGLVSAQYARLSDDGSGSELQVFTEDISGTLNLTAVGIALSGEFQFIAKNTDNDGSRSQVEVRGSFIDVVYNRSGDPFDVAVPLPTREFTGTQEP
jgi:hypothetical protein